VILFNTTRQKWSTHPLAFPLVAISYQLSAISYRLPLTTDYWLLTADR